MVALMPAWQWYCLKYCTWKKPIGPFAADGLCHGKILCLGGNRCKAKKISTEVIQQLLDI